MAYYIRILSSAERCVPFAELQASLASDAPSALRLEVGSETDWEQLVLSHADGTAITSVERDIVGEGSLGAEELEDFGQQITDCMPASAVAWLNDYFRRVRTIYVFQVLSGTEAEGGWDMLWALKDAIWKRSSGIVQADDEGYSNEEGYHILWQFSDPVSGPWEMGVLQDGAWVHFEMDLSDPQHRQAFMNGQVPQGVRLL